MKPTDFAAHLTAFLSHYLPAQRNLSANTIKSYRDTFLLLLRYCRDQRGIATERLCVAQLDPPLVLAFLDYLVTERLASVATRNLRLVALHAFFRYLQTEEPGFILQCQRILAIPCQRQPVKTADYLSADEIAAILQQPDLTCRAEHRDAVLLSVLYDTGARVQEVIDLSVRDVRLESPAQVRLTGKGRKQRVVPLMSNTVSLLSDYLQEHNLNRPECADEPLFQNRSGNPLSRSGIRYILEKYSARARVSMPTLQQPVNPHRLRHSKAIHLLQAGNSLIVIRDILGHRDIKSTEIYVRSDLEMKQRALDKVSQISPAPQPPSWQKNKDLLDWLQSL